MRFPRAKPIKKEWKICDCLNENLSSASLSMLKQLPRKIINNSFAFSGFSFAVIRPYANKEAATFIVAPLIPDSFL